MANVADMEIPVPEAESFLVELSYRDGQWIECELLQIRDQLAELQMNNSSTAAAFYPFDQIRYPSEVEEPLELADHNFVEVKLYDATLDAMVWVSCEVLKNDDTYTLPEEFRSKPIRRINNGIPFGNVNLHNLTIDVPVQLRTYFTDQDNLASVRKALSNPLIVYNKEIYTLSITTTKKHIYAMALSFSSDMMNFLSGITIAEGCDSSNKFEPEQEQTDSSSATSILTLETSLESSCENIEKEDFTSFKEEEHKQTDSSTNTSILSLDRTLDSSSENTEKEDFTKPVFTEEEQKVAASYKFEPEDEQTDSIDSSILSLDRTLDSSSENTEKEDLTKPVFTEEEQKVAASYKFEPEHEQTDFSIDRDTSNQTLERAVDSSYENIEKEYFTRLIWKELEQKIATNIEKEDFTRPVFKEQEQKVANDEITIEEDSHASNKFEPEHKQTSFSVDTCTLTLERALDSSYENVEKEDFVSPVLKEQEQKIDYDEVTVRKEEDKFELQEQLQTEPQEGDEPVSIVAPGLNVHAKVFIPKIIADDNQGYMKFSCLASNANSNEEITIGEVYDVSNKFKTEHKQTQTDFPMDASVTLEETLDSSSENIEKEDFVRPVLKEHDQKIDYDANTTAEVYDVSHKVEPEHEQTGFSIDSSIVTLVETVDSSSENIEKEDFVRPVLKQHDQKIDYDENTIAEVYDVSHKVEPEHEQTGFSIDSSIVTLVETVDSSSENIEKEDFTRPVLKEQKQKIDYDEITIADDDKSELQEQLQTEPQESDESANFVAPGLNVHANEFVPNINTNNLEYTNFNCFASDEDSNIWRNVDSGLHAMEFIAKDFADGYEGSIARAPVYFVPHVHRVFMSGWILQLEIDRYVYIPAAIATDFETIESRLEDEDLFEQVLSSVQNKVSLTQHQLSAFLNEIGEEAVPQVEQSTDIKESECTEHIENALDCIPEVNDNVISVKEGEKEHIENASSSPTLDCIPEVNDNVISVKEGGEEQIENASRIPTLRYIPEVDDDVISVKEEEEQIENASWSPTLHCIPEVDDDVISVKEEEEQIENASWSPTLRCIPEVDDDVISVKEGDEQIENASWSPTLHSIPEVDDDVISVKEGEEEPSVEHFSDLDYHEIEQFANPDFNESEIEEIEEEY